jgi:hypothetical protein
MDATLTARQMMAGAMQQPATHCSRAGVERVLSWLIGRHATRRFTTIIAFLLTGLAAAAAITAKQSGGGTGRRRCARRGAAHDGPLPQGGRLVPLSHGDTYYIVDGPDNPGPLVVLVHGFIGSSAYFKWLSDELVAGGRRVLRYDLMGRGRSSFDGSPHTESAFSAQLAELIYSLGAAHGANEQIDLLGYSMGGAIASKFAATFPAKLRSLVLVAPVGTRAMSIPAAVFAVLRLPILAGLLLRRLVCSASSLQGKDEWEQPDVSGTA